MALERNRTTQESIFVSLNRNSCANSRVNTEVRFPRQNARCYVYYLDCAMRHPDQEMNVFCFTEIYREKTGMKLRPIPFLSHAMPIITTSRDAARGRP